jgi:hypothetical protein
MLTGRESAVKLTQVDIGPFSAGAAWGGVTVEAGSTTGSYSKLEAAEVEVHGAASVTMQASPAGAGGLLKLEKSTVSATGKVFLKSGIATEVKDNTVTSGTEIEVTAQASSAGSCKAESNSFTAPVLNVCQ